MAVSEGVLDDSSVYSHPSDEEMLQIAVERSLSDRHFPPDPDLTTPSGPSSPAPPALAMPTRTSLNPRQRHPDSPSSQLPQVQNCANPPTGLCQLLIKALQRELSPLVSVIIKGDTEALMDLVQQRSNSLTEPNDEGWIALHEAAYYGQLQCLSILINAHPNSVNRCTLKNQTALLLAADRGHIPCVDFLLRHRADPNIANKNQETPLFVACERTHNAIVSLLLRCGAQVNRSCFQGGTALHEACRHEQVEICRMLLEAGADIHSKNHYGIQPLFIAAQHGHVDIICLLAKKGADVNGPARDGASPLFEACKNGHVSAVDVLLSLKADPNQSMKTGLLPLHVAVQNNHARIVSQLFAVTSRVRVQRSGISPLHIAAEKDRDDILELLIESGFDVNAKLSEQRSMMYEDRRSTALYFSVYNGNLEAARMLLEAGANPNLDVFNPIFIAVRLGWTDMASLLLRYGANVNAQISTQPSLFPPAILLSLESLPMLKLLLDYGCNAQACFSCPYAHEPHPAVTLSGHPVEQMQVSRDSPPQRSVLFCEVISHPSFCRVAGLIISVLLDYVSHVCLCSGLLKVLDSHSEWMPIKVKAVPPHPLMQLCRLNIRRLVGVRRLKLLHCLPLPARLIHYLLYDVQCSLT